VAFSAVLSRVESPNNVILIVVAVEVGLYTLAEGWMIEAAALIAPAKMFEQSVNVNPSAEGRNVTCEPSQILNAEVQLLKLHGAINDMLESCFNVNVHVSKFRYANSTAACLRPVKERSMP